jgi:adenylate cyclase
LSVGIHCGEAVSGIVGSSELMEFSVIGSTVNIASRVEGITREHGCDIAITRAVADRTGGRLSVASLGPQRLRGIADEIEVLALA